MKRVFILLLLLIDIVVMILYFSINKRYVNVVRNLSNKLDGSSYEDKLDSLDNEYNKIIDKIDNIISYAIDRYNFKYNDVISKLDSDYDSLSIVNKDLSNKLDGLSKQKGTLRNTYNKIMEEQVMNNTFIIDGVSKINQYTEGYPTGCESAALTILLRYYGLNINMSDVVNRLPKGNLPYTENGIRYGGNPYVEFVGHPNSSSSYGVYEKPIISVAESFKPGIIDGSGMKLDDVLKVVSEGRPVLVWVSMNMAVPYISTSWTYKPTGEKISWMANEHALVIVGYNQNNVVVSDSLNGSIKYYNRNVFESRYNTYGKRAVYY